MRSRLNQRILEDGPKSLCQRRRHIALVEARAHMSFQDLIGTYPDLARGSNERQELREAVVTHGIARTLAGIFYYMAIEEAEIRRNPERRTSALLRELFGA